MYIVRAEQYRRMPWKNGGGSTFEIAVSPPDASVDDMAWRISMAVVDASGPFSSFPGVDRTLTVLDGAGMGLRFDNAGEDLEHVLRADSAPFTFPGDIPATARLIGGTVTDFNVMTRRTRCSHYVRRIDVAGSMEIATLARDVAVFCCGSEVCCALGQQVETIPLQARDCAVSDQWPTVVRIESNGPATVLLAEFHPVPPPRRVAAMRLRSNPASSAY